MYTVKLSDSNGLSANVGYVRNRALHRVEYFKNKTIVAEEYFNTEIEATNSAWHFIDEGELHGNHF